MITKNCIKLSAALALCAGVLAPISANAGAVKLTLINGWKSYGSGTGKPAILAVKGVAYLSGAMKTSGTNNEPFVLPVQFRPAANVYAKVDLCDATNGRIDVFTDGTVNVEAENADFSEAQCFTSLEGVSFALSSDGYKPIKLKDGWTDTIYGTAAPAMRNVSGTITLEGAMSTSGTNSESFVLPAQDRPSGGVFVPADMFGASNGRLVIGTDGSVNVQAESDQSLAYGFTSLDGVSFALDNTGFTPLSLINGWGEYNTRNAAVRLNGKLVQFEGAISTSGTNPVPFVLPANMRPKARVYVPVDLCNATNGRLDITTDGTVTVETEGAFSNAQCITSLEGVWFVH